MCPRNEISGSIQEINANSDAYFCFLRPKAVTITVRVVKKCKMHCKCLWALQVVCRFSLQYLWKKAVRITEKPYTPQRERLCMLWGNPVIFTDCQARWPGAAARRGGQAVVDHMSNLPCLRSLKKLYLAFLISTIDKIIAVSRTLVKSIV